MMHTYYHGCNDSTVILDALLGASVIRSGFHMTPDINVARAYGHEVVAIQLENDITSAHIGTINKEGNYNAQVGSGIEVVLKTQAAINSLYDNIYDAEVTA